MAVLSLCALSLSGCDRTIAWGEVNSIIVGASAELWETSGNAIANGLQPTIFTVRDERTFRITHQDPLGSDWGLLREFRQVLLIGTAEDPWISEVLDARSRDEPLNPPEIFQLYDLWALGQLVTVLLLPPGGGADEVEARLDDLLALFDGQYREYVHARMFISGLDSLLADTLRAAGGFALQLPVIYRWSQEDSVFIFRNDNPDPSQLIREVAITWRSPIPDPLTDADMLDWRLSLSRNYYADEQLVTEEVEPGRAAGDDAREIHGVWESAPGAWPAAGPFLTRTRACPGQDRLYLIDSWLYAPGRDKYEYMLQLRYILDSFECEPALPGAGM
ncbi:MAG: DUF4837 family protein [Gammaproteobacteria bacterium]|nr:DUF4837 family protein [Gammaproteobacteria bacterium]